MCQDSVSCEWDSIFAASQGKYRPLRSVFSLKNKETYSLCQFLSFRNILLSFIDFAVRRWIFVRLIELTRANLIGSCKKHEFFSKLILTARKKNSPSSGPHQLYL